MHEYLLRIDLCHYAIQGLKIIKVSFDLVP